MRPYPSSGINWTAIWAEIESLSVKTILCGHFDMIEGKKIFILHLRSWWFVLIGIEEFAPESNGNCYKVKIYHNRQTFCLKGNNRNIIIFSLYERSSALSSFLGLTWCWTPTWSLGYLRSTLIPPCSQTRQVASALSWPQPKTFVWPPSRILPSFMPS